MAIYAWCTICEVRSSACLKADSHRAAREHVWCIDVVLGGRGGERVRERKYKTKQLAEAREHELHTAFQKGALIPREKHNGLTFSDLATRFEAEHINRHLRLENSGGSYAARIRTFKEHFKNRSVSAFTVSDGSSYIAKRQDAGIMASTIAREVIILQKMMRWAVLHDLIASNPFERLPRIEVPTRRPRWMKPEEVKRLKQAAYDLGDYDLVKIITVGVNTGFRKGNMVRLEAEHIYDGKASALQTKSGDPYDVPVSPTLNVLLSEGDTEGVLLNTEKFDARFRAAARLAGLYTDKRDPRKVTIHTLRHTFAANYLSNGGDIYKLSKFLGHHSVTITEKIYGHLKKEDLQAQSSKLDFPS